MQTIYRKFGFSDLKGEDITRSLIIEKYGEPDDSINHNNYSIELKYNKLGLRFYFLVEDENNPEIQDPKITTLGFKHPFEGKTEEGIVLNKSTMEDVFKTLGKSEWLTAKKDKYWWVDYSEIAFYVQRTKPLEDFNKRESVKKKIVRITIPTKKREEEDIFNEDGQIIHSHKEICPQDGGLHQPIYDEGRAETICNKCGLVMNERMVSYGFGPRTFNAEERRKKEQHGSPITPLLPDLQMATMINKSEKMSPRLRKAVRWDSRYTWKQRNMIQATSEIKRIGEHLNLPQRVKEYAVKLYKKAFQKGLLKGRSIKAMVCASIYYASSAEKVPRTLNEIVERTDLSIHDITRSYQTLIRELNLRSPTIQPKLLVGKYIAELRLPHKVEIIAQQILSQYKKVYSLSGKDPKGLVAAALYFSANHEDIKISQTKIASEIGITEVTLRNRLREIQKFVRYIKAQKAKARKQKRQEEPEKN